MKSIDVNTSTYIDFGVENNNKGPEFEIGDKFKIGNHVGVSRYKKIFAKVYNPNWSEAFPIRAVK